MKGLFSISKIVAVSFIAVLTIVFAGACSSQTQADYTIGKNDQNAVSRVFINQTSNSIVAVSTKAPASDDSLFEEVAALDTSWTSGKSARVYLPKSLVENASAGIDVRLTLSDGRVLDLHGVSFSESGDARIQIDAASGVAYLTYADGNKKEVSTLNAELEQKAAKEAREAEEAAKASESDDDEDSEGGGEYYDYYESSYSSNASDSSSESGASQSAEGCVGDDVVFR